MLRLRDATSARHPLRAVVVLLTIFAACQEDLPQGAILPGTDLRSQIVEGAPVPPLAADKPESYEFQEESSWLNVKDIPTRRRVLATRADAIFNDDDAAYRISFHYSHFGGMPIDAGDFNDDGVDDFMVTDHFAWVDGKDRTGEVHLYFGRRGRPLDPADEVPDVIFYGEEAYGKLGITIAGDGDFNGDGKTDLALGASYTTTTREDGTRVKNAGKVYVVFGGTIDLSSRPAKVRVAEIGRERPGIVFEGGHDDSLQIAYSNGLDFGDFDGDGVDDLLIGSYNPYQDRNDSGPLDWRARAWLIYGAERDPFALRPYRLGVDVTNSSLTSHQIDVPEREWTRVSLGWSTNFVDDIDGDGYEDIGFGTHGGGTWENGAAYIFLGGPARLPGNERTSVAEADVVVSADTDPHGVGSQRLIYGSLLGVRPAGDVNGDGRPDVLITSRTARLKPDGEDPHYVGAVGVLPGRRELPASVNFADLPHIFHGLRPGSMGQPAMDVGRDLDGDDYADILINDAYYDDWLRPGRSQARGRLWLLRGGPDLPKYVSVEESADLTFLADTRVPGLFGYTWTTGDWNDDGRGDIVIGDHYAGDRLRNVHAGKAYMFYNGSSFDLSRVRPARKVSPLR